MEDFMENYVPPTPEEIKQYEEAYKTWLNELKAAMQEGDQQKIDEEGK